jgi:hypothetical protein
MLSDIPLVLEVIIVCLKEPEPESPLLVTNMLAEDEVSIGCSACAFPHKAQKVISSITSLLFQSGFMDYLLLKGLKRYGK